jgi:hypothetical protein
MSSAKLGSQLRSGAYTCLVAACTTWPDIDAVYFETARISPYLRFKVCRDSTHHRQRSTNPVTQGTYKKNLGHPGGWPITTRKQLICTLSHLHAKCADEHQYDNTSSITPQGTARKRRGEERHAD